MLHRRVSCLAIHLQSSPGHSATGKVSPITRLANPPGGGANDSRLRCDPWLGSSHHLQVDEDHLFGLHVDVALPRPLLLEMPVGIDVVDVLLAQRAAHIQAEHIFGPTHARDLV
jgi:hypothetical protein